MARHTQAGLAPEEGRGWSLIELLLATSLFLIALLSAAPLFMRAVVDVRAGAALSAASNLAQSRLESSAQSGDFPAGSASDLEYYSFDQRRWLSAPPDPPDRAVWVRETTLRRYPLSAIADGRLDPGESAPSCDRPPPLGPGPCLVGVEAKVSRRVGGHPIARLERLEWAND